jgi:hypothetical protein
MALKLVKRISLVFFLTLISILWIIRYVKRKLNEMRVAQKEKTFYQENIQSRFEQIGKDCVFTTLSLTMTMDKKIRELSYAVEDITASLQNLSKKKSLLTLEEKALKIDLWNQLKIVGK